MLTYTIKELLNKGKEVNFQKVCVQGWVRSFRSNRFIALNDGSTLKNIQIVIDFENFNPEILKRIHTAASLKIIGEVVESQGAGQEIEIIA
ncbi:MAG: asparagine--tRNA ligase, partial [Weeksellaceae bacterium]|nr:asparagine--tRNA ligase [Weeksellaceae bacterium]